MTSENAIFKMIPFDVLLVLVIFVYGKKKNYCGSP